MTKPIVRAALLALALALPAHAQPPKETGTRLVSARTSSKSGDATMQYHVGRLTVHDALGGIGRHHEEVARG